VTARLAPPPFGFYVLALEVYASIAAAMALYAQRFIAPLSMIFFALDHTEFMVFIVAVICGVDYYVKPSVPRAAICVVSLVPMLFLIAAVIARALAPR